MSTGLDRTSETPALAAEMRYSSPTFDERMTIRHLSANSGLPSITVPAGFVEEGLPVGLELLGRAWSEGLLIELAYAYEQFSHHRLSPGSTPPLHDQ